MLGLKRLDASSGRRHLALHGFRHMARRRLGRDALRAEMVHLRGGRVLSGCQLALQRLRLCIAVVLRAAQLQLGRLQFRAKLRRSGLR
jgi:hypothetical protein